MTTKNIVLHSELEESEEPVALVTYDDDRRAWNLRFVPGVTKEQAASLRQAMPAMMDAAVDAHVRLQ